MIKLMSLLTLMFLGTPAFANVIIVKDVLVKGHGGQFYGDVVAKSVNKTTDNEFYEDLRLVTRYGAEYFLVNSDLAKPSNPFVSDFICGNVAPANWYNQSYPHTNDNGTVGDAVYFLDMKTAAVSMYTEFQAYKIRGSVTCSATELMHIGE